MSQITVIHNPSTEVLAENEVLSWPIWEKSVSSFPWTYDAEEVCYILEGEVTVQPENGAAVTIKKGDMVTFPKGMSCHWTIHKDIKKHYQFF